MQRAQSRESFFLRKLKKRSSGCRSEEKMKTPKQIPFILTAVLFLIFAAYSPAEAQEKKTEDEPAKVRTVYVITDKKEQAQTTRPRISVVKTEASREASRAAFDLERAAFQLINQKRLQSGLSPLEWNEQIAELARSHSLSMADYKFFSHKGLNGNLIDERAVEFGLDKWRAIGENIAFNQGFENPVEFAVERWMQSVSHRQNLLHGRWKESGIGVAVTSDGKYYFTQIFLLR